jgi:hypothetical protein
VKADSELGATMKDKFLTAREAALYIEEKTGLSCSYTNVIAHVQRGNFGPQRKHGSSYIIDPRDIDHYYERNSPEYKIARRVGIAAKFRKTLERKGYTNAQLARHLDCTQSAVSLWCHGHRNIPQHVHDAVEAMPDVEVEE